MLVETTSPIRTGTTAAKILPRDFLNARYPQSPTGTYKATLTRTSTLCKRNALAFQESISTLKGLVRVKSNFQGYKDP